MKRAVYPGSFDPITNGHLDILIRASNMFDEVIILVAENSAKKERFSVQDRVMSIKEATKDIKNVKVDSFNGLTLDYAKKHDAKYLIRGLRAVTDFEYEFQLAAANDFIDSEVESIFLMSKSQYSFINSSTVMELYLNGVDVSKIVPKSVVKMLKNKY